MAPTKRSVIRVIGTCLSISTSILAVATWSSGDQGGARGRECFYPRYLENSGSRARYEEALTRARETGRATRLDVEAMYGAIVPASSSGGGGFADEFSVACLSCHDGIVARAVSPKMPESPGSRMQLIIEKHPIGVDYASYADSRGRFKNYYEVDPRIVFVNGRLSCITCHDPLNPEPFHLALNSTWSQLCLNCHNV